jgi:hypothetical protein
MYTEHARQGAGSDMTESKQCHESWNLCIQLVWQEQRLLQQHQQGNGAPHDNETMNRQKKQIIEGNMMKVTCIFVSMFTESNFKIWNNPAKGTGTVLLQRKHLTSIHKIYQLLK